MVCARMCMCVQCLGSGNETTLLPGFLLKTREAKLWSQLREKLSTFGTSLFR